MMMRILWHLKLQRAKERLFFKTSCNCQIKKKFYFHPPTQKSIFEYSETFTYKIMKNSLNIEKLGTHFEIDS